MCSARERVRERKKDRERDMERKKAERVENGSARVTGHNVHLRSASPTSIQDDVIAPVNDSMDFLSNRKPIDEMLNKYTAQPQREDSPISEQISEHITENLSEDLPTDKRVTGHNVHLRSASPTSIQDDVIAPVNDSMDFLSNRKPIDEMLNKYTAQPPREDSPISEQISEHITENLSEDLPTDKDGGMSTKEWEDECKDLSKKLDNIGIKTPTADDTQQYRTPPPPPLFRISGGRTLVLTDSLSKFKADSISKNGLFIYILLEFRLIWTLYLNLNLDIESTVDLECSTRVRTPEYLTPPPYFQNT
eukprot:sb/3467203/